MLIAVKVGRPQPKIQSPYVGRTDALNPSVVRRIELKGDGCKYMPTHLKEDIFLHKLDRGQNILLVTKAGHER